MAEKLSPRQQMIGMMYLILTAMLALNVSKEAVEAFKNVDNGLTLTISNYSLKNDAIYKEFDRAAAENPQKAGGYKSTAYEVKERADEIFDYLQDLKIEIIKTAEGEDTEWQKVCYSRMNHNASFWIIPQRMTKSIRRTPTRHYTSIMFSEGQTGNCLKSTACGLRSAVFAATMAVRSPSTWHQTNRAEKTSI